MEYDEENKKTVIHYGVGCKKGAHPINMPVPSPYKEAKVLQRIVEEVNGSDAFRLSDFKVEDEKNPYQTLSEYQEQTGLFINNYNAVTNVEPEYDAMSPIQPILKRIGKYYVKSDGLYREAKNPMIQEDIHVCNFVHKIIEFQKSHFKDGSTRLDIAYSVAGHEDEILTVSSEEYGNICDDILKKLPDCCFTGNVSSSGKAYYREFAAHIYREAKNSIATKDIYHYHGWERVDGKMIYLSNARDDCKCSCWIPPVLSETTKNLFLQGLNIINIGRKVFNDNGTLNIVQTYRVSLPFFLYIHLGFTVKLFQDAGLDVQFILMLVGKSGSLKTSICKAFAEPFNAGGMLRLESTPRALELYREASTDMTMLADDIFAPKSSLKNKFELILRAFGDNIGRAKSAGKDFNDIVRTVVRGGCIVTAENQLGSQQSSVLRYVTVKIDHDSIDTNILQDFQNNQKQAQLKNEASIVQLYFAAFIKHLEQNYDSIVQYLTHIEEVTSDVPNLSRRYKKVYAVFQGIIDIILNWGKANGALSVNDADNLKNCWSSVIRQLMSENEEMVTTAEPWQLFILTLQRGIATGAILLANEKKEYETAGGKFIGYEHQDNDSTEYVLDSTRVFSFVKHQLQELGKDFVTEPSNIFKDLFKNKISSGYSNKDGSGHIRQRYLKRVRLHGHQVEMLVISKEKMEKVIVELEEAKS